MGSILRTFLRSRRVPLCFEKQLQRRSLSQAFIRGPSEPPLLEETIGENFARIVSAYGDRPAVIAPAQGRRLTYADLDRDSNVLARGFQSIGVQKGDRICVSLGNNIEFATLTYALFKLGAILVPLNPALNASQVISALNHLSARHLVIGTETNLPHRPPRSNQFILETIVPDLRASKLASEVIPSLTHVVLVDNSSSRINPSSLRALTPFRSISKDADSSAPKPFSSLRNTDVVNIQFTSGTTSTPKAACLSHRNILNNGNQIGDRMLLTPEDIVCCPPPLFHCFGSILGYMATATHASAIVFPSEAFNPLATLKAVQDEKCTALHGVPTMFVAELELINNGTVTNKGFQNLRTGIIAGSSVPAELMKKLHTILNLSDLTICYGMTETSPISLMTRPDDPMEKRVSTVGRLLPHVQAKVVDPSDHDRVLEIGERGELAVHGYHVMKEYWGQPDRTAEVMKTDSEGRRWMHTGDEASIDEDGYVSITGRIKDLIIRGGENIQPLEIENCLFAHPKVIEVSVVGLPDEEYGEVVAAFVILRPKGDGEGASTSVEEVRSWVREKLNHHLVPKYVLFVKEFPKTASGKIEKFKLRKIGQDTVKELIRV